MVEIIFLLFDMVDLFFLVFFEFFMNYFLGIIIFLLVDIFECWEEVL